MSKVVVDIDDAQERLIVHFRYTQDDIVRIRTVRGRHWDPEAKINTVPADLHTARELRVLFGDRMELTKDAHKWAGRLVRREQQREQLHVATDAELVSTPQLILDAISGVPLDLPGLPPKHPYGRQRPPRPYQRADIKLMSIASCMNCNDVGTGKTIETIGAIFEAGVYPDPILYMAPRRTLVSVWEREFGWFTDYRVLTSEDPTERHGLLRRVATTPAERVALGLIADDVRLVRYCTRDAREEWLKKNKGKQHKLHASVDYKGNWYRFRDADQKLLYDIEWGAVVVDEFHTTGLNNRLSLFSNSVRLLKAKRKWFNSGTPMGGKARRLWPVLNQIDRKVFSSEWHWIEDWLEVQEEEFYKKGDRGGMPTGKAKKVGNLRPGTEEQFYEAHRQYMTRRTKRDALPGLPDMVEILVETPMLLKQKRQYRDFDEDHEIIIGKKRLSGNIVLSQYTRLRQMADSALDWDQFYTKPVATHVSGKIEALLERLDENGIRPFVKSAEADSSSYEPGSRAYVGTIDVSFAEVVLKEIEAYGVECGLLTGKTKDSKPILERFESEDEAPYVIVMTMATGGSGLNLEQAGSAHALNDPWDPDQSYQFFGRGDRGSRERPLRCYTYRTPNTIQDYMAQVAGDKKITNNNILNFVSDIEYLRKEGR